MRKFNIKKFKIETVNVDIKHYLTENGRIKTVGTIQNHVMYDKKYICQYFLSNEFGCYDEHKQQPFEYVYSPTNPIKTIQFINSVFESHKSGKNTYHQHMDFIKKHLSKLSNMFECDVVKSSIENMCDIIQVHDKTYKSHSSNPNDYLFDIVIGHKFIKGIEYLDYLKYKENHNIIIFGIRKNNS